MADAVLDASALLALLNDEPGAAMVAAVLPGAVVSSVNLSEVAAVLAELDMPMGEIRGVFSELALATVAFDDELALIAAELRPATRRAGLSLGDRACLALAKARRLPALTADRAWTGLKLGIEIRLIR